MFQATRSVSRPSRLEGHGRELGGRPATDSPDGRTDGRAGGGRPTGQPCSLAQRNEATIRLGALLNTVQGSLLPTYHAHTHTHTHTGLRNGPNKWPWCCGLIARPVSGVEWWSDLLGTVALAYNATVHSTTCYSPHELCYSFAPACPLDAMVTASALEPADSTDECTLQALERLQEVATFVHAMTGKQMQHVKKYYDTSVKPQQFEAGEKVLLYDPQKKRGRYAKWQAS